MVTIGKKVVIILGNGFTIDLINHMKTEIEIDLTNLFMYGDSVPWPSNGKPGFLSQQYCPDLWKLGARPNMPVDKANKLIEDIITCANVSALAEKPQIMTESSNVYIRAYHELISYLRQLFIFYNSKIDDENLRETICNSWGWGKLFLDLYNNPAIESVSIITYNYDIFLERVLKILSIPYRMAGFEKEQGIEKFLIIKPHGSISFFSKRLLDVNRFSIKYNRDNSGGTLEELMLDYDVNLSKVSSINTMIPPAGEATRYEKVWSSKLRSIVEQSIKELNDDDDIIFGGLSYSSVDRMELDSIITAIPTDANVKNINPDTANTFCAVLASIFCNYVQYTTSDLLRRLYQND